MNYNILQEKFLKNDHKEWSNNNLSLLIMLDDHNYPHCHIFKTNGSRLDMVIVRKDNNKTLSLLQHSGDLTKEESTYYKKCRVLIPRYLNTMKGNSRIDISELQFDFIVQDKPEFVKSVLSIFNKKGSHLPYWKEMLSFWWSISEKFDRYDLDFSYTINGKI